MKYLVESRGGSFGAASEGAGYVSTDAVTLRGFLAVSKCVYGVGRFV
jgi:hypothetical protein